MNDTEEVNRIEFFQRQFIFGFHFDTVSDSDGGMYRPEETASACAGTDSA